MRQTEADLAYENKLKANPDTKKILEALENQKKYAYTIDNKKIEQVREVKFIKKQLQ